MRLIADLPIRRFTEHGYAAAFLRHPSFAVQKRENSRRFSKYVRQDWLGTSACIKVTRLETGGDGLAGDLAQVVSEPIFDIARLVEAARHESFDTVLSSG